MTKTKISDALVITKQQFATPTEFSQHIESLSVKNKIACMDALIDFCERNDIDVESVSKLITRQLKSKIRTEAEDRNLIAKKSSSPSIL